VIEETKVVGVFFVSHFFGNFIIPTGRTPSFFRGVGQPPTSKNQSIESYDKSNYSRGIPGLHIQPSCSDRGMVQIGLVFVILPVGVGFRVATLGN